MKSISFLSATFCCFIFGAIAQAQLDSASFEHLHNELQPDLNESWRQIPWQLSVIEAQKIAIREQKPIFIWAMDGHPLGCT